MNVYRTSLTITVRMLFIFSFSMLMILSSASCDEDDEVLPSRPEITESTIANVLKALGGESAIKEVTHMSYRISGTSYEHEEDEPDQDGPLVTRNYSFILTTELMKKKLRMDYTRLESVYPINYISEGPKIIIDNKEASISGQYDLGSVYFGLIAPQGMYAPRIETTLKNFAMSNPIEMVKRLAAMHTDLSFKTENNIFTIPTMVEGLDIEMYIDLETHLPNHVKIQEADFLHGDTRYNVRYADWDSTSTIAYPTKLIHSYDLQLYKEETISEVNLDPALSDDHFVPEPAQNMVVYNEELAPKGIMHTQWYDRFFNLGFPIDLPLDIGFVIKDQWVAAGLPDQTIGDNVKIIGRPDLSYWAVAIKTDVGVIIVEAPLHQEWTATIIETVKSEAGFPGEPIIAVIPTHTHVDHFGGIRELAAETGKVYIHGKGRSALDAVLNSTHNINPDRLSVSGGDVFIQNVDEITKLDNGSIEIHPVDLEGTGNPHSEEMLMVYVPEHELLIQADLFNAGALVALFAGQGAQPMSEVTKASWRLRARFLLLYIEQNDLKVSKVMGIHGGVAPIEQLQFVAQ